MMNSLRLTPTTVNTPDTRGWTPLHHAACEGKDATVKQLLSLGAKVDLQNDEGWTPLHLASANGHIGVARLLLAQGASIRARDFEGRTPLQRACFYGRPPMIEFLLINGANIEEEDDKSKTPLHAAVSSRTTRSGLTTIELLLRKGAKLEAITDIGWTPLHSAVRYSDEETVALLLEHGANPEAKNQFGHTPLIMACYEDKLDLGHRIAVVKLLIKYKANLEAQDNLQFTALHHTCMEGNLRLTMELLKAGANPQALCKKGQMPLHYAAKNGHAHIVQLLAKKESLPSASSSTTSSLLKQLPPAADRAASEPFPSNLSTHSQPIPSSSPTPPTLESLQNQIDELQTLVKQQAVMINSLQTEQTKLFHELQQLKISPLSKPFPS